MATYPAGIYSYTNRSGTQTLLAGTHSTAHNEISAEVIAIETELGVNPKGIYVDVGTRLDALASAIGAQHTQNTDAGTSYATFYMNGASGALIKEVGGAYAVRNNADTLYVDFTCDDLTCATINGITSVSLAAMETDSHSHANKGLLDTYTQTEVNLADAVSLKHAQNTDTGTDNETFQMNNGNATSAKIKVDDLTPTIVDIRNAGDNAFADIRAANFRGTAFQMNNADLNRPTIRFEDSIDRWQFSNDGVTFIDFFPAAGALSLVDTASIDLSFTIGGALTAAVIPGGVDHNQLLNYSSLYHFAVSGASGELQYNDGANGLASENVFYYNPTTDTLFVPNINVSGFIIGATAAGGTTSDTWEVNTDGNGLIIDTTGMTGDATMLATDWVSLEALGIQDLVDPNADRIMFWDDSDGYVDWLSISTGISITGKNLTTNDSQIVHDNLSGFVADEHIAHSGVNINAGTGLTGGGDISASRTLSLSHLGIQSLVDPNNDRIMFWDDTSGYVDWLTPSTGISITGTNLTTNDSQIVHDNLSGFVANEHIDHSTVSITGGTGLAGGGAITGNQTITLSHLGIQSLVDPDADRLMLWDDTDGSVQWVTVGTGLTYTHASHTLSATGTVTDLDSAYNGGSAITVDTGAIALTGSIVNVMSIASNSNGSHLRLTGDPTVAAPVDGDLWYDGTSLNFYDGSTTTDLLAGGGATLTRATFTNASLTAGVLTITHNAGLSAPYTVMVTIFDNTYKQIIPDSITGATNSVAVDLSSYVTAGGGSISGTWGYGYIA